MDQFDELKMLEGWLVALAGDGRAKQVWGMLKEGVKPDARDEAGNTAAMMAIRAGCHDSFCYLAWHGADLDAANEAGLTAAHVAVLKGNSEAVRDLARLGAAMGLADRKGMTPLQYAAARNDWESVEELIGAGVDLDSGQGGRGTALHIAAGNGMKGEEVARMLLKAGADPYATCSCGAKPCARANGQTLADIRNAQTLIDLDRIAEGFGIKTAMAA